MEVTQGRRQAMIQEIDEQEGGSHKVLPGCDQKHVT